MYGNLVDLTGKGFGRWTVVSRAENDKRRNHMWNCVCECETETVVHGYSLTSGNTKSCGCLRLESRTKHGESKTKEYQAHYNLIDRCYNEDNDGYEYYHKNSITVCDRWRGKNGVKNFLEDMGRCPRNCNSIDRIDNTKGYFKENCRWATDQEQNQNKSNSKYWCINGEKFNCAREAAEKFRVTDVTIKNWCDGYTQKGKFYPPKPNCWSELKYPIEN